LLVAFNITAYCQPPQQPILRIEPGMHTSKGYKISADAEGKYLLTASIDKTARFWDAQTGNLLKTFRIPIGGTGEGTLYSCSLSPDGRIAALSGATGFEWDNAGCIYLINTQTGAIINRIKKLPYVIQDLEFSPDGNWLAACFSGNNGVYVFETRGWGEYKKLAGYTKEITSIAFKPGGGLATVSADGKIRLYNSSFEKINEKTGVEGQLAYCLAFNPTGDLLAVGYRSSAAVEVRNAADLSVQYKPAVAAEEGGGFSSLCFSSDGSRLYGGASFGKFVREENKWKHFVRRWNNAGRSSYTDLLLIENTIADMKSLRSGSMAVIGFDPPDIAVLNASDKVSWYLSAQKNDFTSRDKSHLRINNSGSSIGFTPLGQKAYSFDILQKKLEQEESLYPAPLEANAGTVVSDWNRNWHPVINGKKVPGFDGRSFQECLSTDITSNGNQVVLSESWNVTLWDKNASLLWATPMETNPFAVNISGNDKVVAAAAVDGSIHWFSMASGKELLTFYLLPDNKRWVLFTPTGYYDASPGAEDFLGWHLNNGPDEAPSFYPVSRFKENFYRPDIIDALFETYNEKDAVTLANSRSIKKEIIAETDIRQKLPPTITISSPANGSSISNNTVTISYAVKSTDDAPVKNLRVLIDGRPAATERGAKVAPSAVQKITVTVPSQDCIITLLAENDNGTSPETNLHLKWVTPAAPNEDLVFKPRLYVLAIGISDYNSPDLKLGFASKDAGDFATAIYKQKGTLFSDVLIKKLIDKGAAKDSITDGLDWIQRQTGQKDVAMIFYAGHGINDNNGVFYMLPVAADLERIRTTCLNFEELKQTVSSIAGKVVVFIDACHSGNVMGSSRRGVADINAMVNELSSTENGAITFTSSTGKEFSLEDPAWGNGAFTKAVIEGLSGMAAISGKNKITTKSLDAYISERVKELTKGRQHPTSVTPPNVPDFPIAVKQ
jgi:WD40 repeat protein